MEPFGVRGLTDPVASQVLEPADEAFGAALGAWSPERQYSGLSLGEGSGLTNHSGSAGAPPFLCFPLLRPLL